MNPMDAVLGIAIALCLGIVIGLLIQRNSAPECQHDYKRSTLGEYLALGGPKTVVEYACKLCPERFTRYESGFESERRKAE